MATEPVVPVLKEGPPRGAPASPLQAVQAQRIEGATTQRIREELAAEVPVAMQYNNRPHAVMLATPADLEDFAVGFALTERIVTQVGELKLIDVQWTDHGVALEMQIPAERAVALLARDRNLTGRSCAPPFAGRIRRTQVLAIEDQPKCRLCVAVDAVVVEPHHCEATVVTLQRQIGRVAAQFHEITRKTLSREQVDVGSIIAMNETLLAVVD